MGEMKETGNGYSILLDLPLEKEDLIVVSQAGLIQVKAFHRFLDFGFSESMPDPALRTVAREVSFPLPQDASPKGHTISFSSGIAEINIPKI